MRWFLLPMVLFSFVSNCFCQGTSPSDSPESNSQTYTILRSNLGLSGSSNTVNTGVGEYTLNQSVGQAGVIGTSSNNILTLLQGYQQHMLTLESLSTEEKFQVLIGPNPANEWVNIIFKETITEDVTIRLIDLSGSVVKTKKYAASQIQRVSLEGLSTGMYMLQVISQNKQLISKLLKQ